VFYHTGEIGDILAGLTVMKLFGGGRLQIGPDIGLKNIRGYPRSAGNQRLVEYAYDFLLEQPYVRSVEWAEKQRSVDVNLNSFRKWAEDQQPWKSWAEHHDLSRHLSLSDMHLRAYGLTLPDFEPWLRVDTAWIYDGKPIVIHRSPRYHNVPDLFPWRRIVQEFGDHCLFVGLASEHQEFCKLFGDVQFFYVENMLEMARLIHGSALFIGNQSSPFWIAEGLKHNLILEAWNLDPNCFFDRPDHYHVMDGDWALVERVIQDHLQA
jgi:hypothetical protein